MTKREMFVKIATVNAADTEIVEFCNREIELLDNRKNSKTPTKTQKANEGIMDTIAEALKGFEGGVTVTELMASNEVLKDLSNQKVSALLRKMRDDGRVIKTIEGKKALFSLA
jgi:hypothetical protein